MADDIVESAKAVQETAKAVGKSIDALSGTGNFFDRVFGGLVEDGVGIVADKVKYYRLERVALLAKKTEDKLKERGIEFTNAVQPKLAVPLIENATLEDNDELHTLWSNLLTNAMDPRVSQNVKHIHVSILKEMEPLDIGILSTVAREMMANHSTQNISDILFDRAEVAEKLEVSIDNAELSLLNLMRLGCISPGIIVSRP